MPQSGGVFKLPLLVVGFIFKHKFLVITLAVLIPTIIHSIRTAIDTNNPTYPLFQLGARLLSADNVLNTDVELLRKDIKELVGMEKPTEGVWKKIVYQWHFFWRVDWILLGNIWLIFLPLIIIYKIIRLRNLSKPAANLVKSIFYFLLYLFVVNTIVLIRNVIRGETDFVLPTLGAFKEYQYLLFQIFPFHGLYNLGNYLLMKIIGV